MRLSAKFFVRLFLSVGVSAIFAVFSLRNTDLGAVVSAIASAHQVPILGYLAILIVVHLVKTVRWGLLLRPIGAVTFRRLNAASAVGFMLMVLMPLRLGELARPLLVARPSPDDPTRLPRTATLATCLVERVVDTLAVGVLGIISLYVLAPEGEAAKLVENGAHAVTAAFGALCVGLVVAYARREQTVAFLRRLLTPISSSLAERVAHLTDGFVRGMQLGSAWNAVSFLLLTAGYWALHVWGFWMVAGAFDLEITPLMACTVLACQVVGIMIPAGPGQVGTSQFFTQLGLSIFVAGAMSVPDVVARTAGYANTIWLLQFGQQVLTGIVFLVAGHISLQGLFARWEADPLATRSGDVPPTP